MNGGAVQRRLAAILAADVVGFSRLMGNDEAGTLASLRALRAEVIDPRVADHNGRIFKTTGDGVLVEFPSVVNAVACAVDIQRGIEGRNADLPEEKALRLRIGVNLGDVIVEGDDIFGDGVNVAARLEGIATPGGIAISANVLENIGKRFDLRYADLGEQTLKNIDRPVRVYAVQLGPVAPAQPPALALPDKPSIAVLPFVNMSADAEQEYFADGLTEDLITDLSRHAGLFVIARNSSFAYRGKSVDARQIARDLGVRYLLEGSARRAAGRVRINVQLIDAIGGGHMWAERFDRNLEDVFALQDEVTAKIVEALIGRLVAPPPRNRPKNMEAYDLCVRARVLLAESAGMLEALREAALLLEQAIALDPDYAEAYRWLAFNRWSGWAHCGEPMQPNRRIAVELSRKAVDLDPNDAGNHWILGFLLAYERQWPEVDSAFARALELDPNNANALVTLGDIAVMNGEPETAIELIQKAFRLDPHPLGWYYWQLGHAQYAAGQYQSAVQTLRTEATYRSGSRRILAASLAQLGLMDEARREASLYMASNPRFRISDWATFQPYKDEVTLAHFAEGYRKAGLPE